MSHPYRYPHLSPHRSPAAPLLCVLRLLRAAWDRGLGPPATLRHAWHLRQPSRCCRRSVVTLPRRRCRRPSRAMSHRHRVRAHPRRVAIAAVMPSRRPSLVRASSRDAPPLVTASSHPRRRRRRLHPYFGHPPRPFEVSLKKVFPHLCPPFYLYFTCVLQSYSLSAVSLRFTSVRNFGSRNEGCRALFLFMVAEPDRAPGSFGLSSGYQDSSFVLRSAVGDTFVR